jgi:SNF2 family DNA or RNA helicase
MRSLFNSQGLGKTIQTLALMVGERSTDPDIKSTLIIAPLSLIHQWKQEIESKSEKNTLRVYIHHGNSRVKDVKMFRRYDVVCHLYFDLRLSRRTV